MACGNNNPQQNNTQTMPQQMSTTNGQPPMSLVGGGTNLAPNAASFTNVAPSQQIPQGLTVGGQQAINPQQMAQQAASMPTANSGGSTDGIMPDGSYNPKYDQTIQQIAGRMKAMQDSGAFLTPYQKAQQAHPILMGIADAMKTFGQGLTHQPFATANQENQTALQNTQAQDAANLMSPTNMMNMMFMKQMTGAGGMGGGASTPPKAKMPNPDDIAAARKAGATTWNDQTGEFLAPVKIGQ